MNNVHIRALAFVATALLFDAQALAQPISIVAPETNAIVVLPESASPIADYAAQELVHHLREASGVTLDTVREPDVPGEDATRIFLGPTAHAQRAGIDVAALPSETFILRTVRRERAKDRVAGDVIVAAADGPGDPLSAGNPHSGVLWGVYEILDRDLGVRWLWPGELGTHIPRRTTIEVGPYDTTVRPRFQQRNLRPSLGPVGFATADPRLAFTSAAREQYARNQSVFLRRHRMGQSANTYFSERKYGSGHAFHGWWAKYGAEHPEWFQLNPDGTRGPTDPSRPHKFSMCVSNPELHRFIVDLWAEQRAKNPGEPLGLGIGENDDSAACVCAPCRAWDGAGPDLDSVPAGLERSYLPVQAGTRYARFARALLDLAREIDPDVKLHFYAYLNYFWAPEPTVDLDLNVIVGFVPWFRWAGWFPRTNAEQEWIKQQWTGWRETGASLYYRPNWFLDGYTMPHVYMHQFADAFRFYIDRGAVATDFDSLQGMWATQGPNLYLLARMHVRPDRSTDEILDEFYSAFGPAKVAVQKYFTNWETYSTENRERAARAIQSRKGGHFRRYAHYAQVADELYPPEVFKAPFERLERAKAVAESSSDPIRAERMAFLRVGLEHARLCVATARVMNDPNATSADRVAALARLAKYRRDIESTGVANMDRAAIIETDSWQERPGFGDAWPD